VELFDHLASTGHERIVFCHDPACGLRGIIAIHSRTLGPAAGGCRMLPYTSDDDALADVLRLSEAMTYKNALAGLALGGGKSVLLGDPRRHKTPELLRAFGRCVSELGGAYWTAEDVGIGVQDVEEIAAASEYVFGTRIRAAGTGDPSAFTARGVYQGIRAAIWETRGAPNLKGVRVAVQGVGAVGFELCRLLAAESASLVIADPSVQALGRVQAAFDAEVVTPERIHAVDADVFSPCALGGVINQNTLPALGARIIAGAANNQLESPACGVELWRRGILFAPDFLINAGGMMHASGEIFGHFDEQAVMRAIDGIYDSALGVFERARKEAVAPELVCLQVARERIANAAR
jgi:leucine dehydrogenase